MYPIHEEQDSAFYDLQLATQLFEFIFNVTISRSNFKWTFHFIRILISVTNMNSWLVFFIKLVVIQTVVSEYGEQSGNSTVNRLYEKEEVSKTLSRRKRFVIFPEGSSLQLGT